MFESAYQLGMEYASRILFALAFLLFAMGVAGGYLQYSGSPGSRAYWLLFLDPMFKGVNDGVIPLIGAVIVHRFDRAKNQAPKDRDSK